MRALLFMEHTDLELMDFMLKDLYREIQPQDIRKDNFANNGFNISDNQFYRVKRLVLTAGIMEELEENQFMMTAKGLEFMMKFGSYSAYLNGLKEEKKNEKRLRGITILVGLCTIVTTFSGLLKSCG